MDVVDVVDVVVGGAGWLGLRRDNASEKRKSLFNRSSQRDRDNQQGELSVFSTFGSRKGIDWKTSFENKLDAGAGCCAMVLFVACVSLCRVMSYINRAPQIKTHL